MTIFIRKALLFALLAAVIYLMIFAVLFYVRTYNDLPFIFRTTQGNTYRGGHTYIAFRQFNPKEKYDVIVLGSSHAYRGYDPEIFKRYNYKMFNLGTNSQINLVSYFIAKEFIRKENCKNVILDIYDPVFKRTSLESVSDYIQNSTSDKNVLGLIKEEKDIRTINMLTMRVLNNFNGIFNPDTAGVNNGYIPYNTQLQPDAKRLIRDNIPDEKALIHFEKLIKYLQGEGINVIAAEHPLPARFTIDKTKHELLRQTITPILRKYNIPFYDHLYDSTMTDIPYFSNTNHLSVSGVEKYNTTLLNELIRDNNLKK